MRTIFGRSVGPYLNPNFLQKLSTDNKSRRLNNELTCTYPRRLIHIHNLSNY